VFSNFFFFLLVSTLKSRRDTQSVHRHTRVELGVLSRLTPSRGAIQPVVRRCIVSSPAVLVIYPTVLGMKVLVLWCQMIIPVVVDRVQFLTDSSVWFDATLGGDNDLISLGENPNRQDGSVLNTGQGFPLTIGKRHRCPYGNDVRVRYRRGLII